MPGRRALVLGCACFLVSIAASAAPPAGSTPSKSEIAKQIKFGTEMARQGNWHEAIFRWRRALAADPNNPRLHNNIAVAYESLGQYDKADAEYRTAASLPGAPEEIGRNRDLFDKFFSRYKEAVPAKSDSAEPPAPNAAAPPPPPAPPAAAPPAAQPPSAPAEKPPAEKPPDKPAEKPLENPAEKPKDPDAKAP